MDKKQAKEFHAEMLSELGNTRAFLIEYNEKRDTQTPLQAFDSIVNDDGSNDTDYDKLPTSLKQLLTSKIIKEAGSEGVQQIFDGLENGIAEYQHRNGGEKPSAQVILTAFDAAVSAFTEYSTDPDVERMLDSLSFGHHEALSVVPAAINVTIMTIIASSLPIVAQLPNPTGSNEVPLIFGRSTANMRMGVFNKGDYIDGDKAGQPYLENRHTLTMTGSGATFTTPVTVGYTKDTKADGTVKFVADTATKSAPFLGGRVTITVKGGEVANDHNRNHSTFSGVSVLQPLGDGAITIAGKQYLVKSARADLDNNKVDVEFDTAFTTPDTDDVEAHVIFDYERKDADGKYILTPPGLDMTFEYNSVYAAPMRAKVTATIDAVTQMQNELGLSPTASVLAVIQNKYFLEQTGRLLREQVSSCKAQGNRVHVFDAVTPNYQYATIDGQFSKLKNSLGLAKSKLSQALNRPVGGVDIFVGMMGAAVFNGLPDTMYNATDVSYGDESSIYRIGSLNNGTNIYYVPESLGVFNETDSVTTAEALILPRPTNPATAPFVGHTAVPPIVLNGKADPFEEQIAVYARIGADRNPNQNFNNQGMLLQMINIPSM